MKKELIICCVVVILVLILNAITQNHTKKIMGEITSGLNEVRNEIVSKDEENLKEDIKKIIDKWEEKSNSLAYYIEHEELEKVEMYLWEINSNIETREYNIAVQSLDTCNFMISHIEEKYKFLLKNIF